MEIKKWKNKVVRLLDSLYREPKFILKHYHIKAKACGKTTARNIFMVDGKIPHGGMFDRLKGLISVYAISKALKTDFYLNFVYPFELGKYLEPNTYDWRISKEDVCYDYPLSRPIIAYGEYLNPSRLWKKRKNEAHFYYGYNSLDKINAHFHTEYDWGTLYRELFRPTAYLQSYLDRCKQDIGGDYIVVHTRFLNLLGDKVETDINPELSDADKELLMENIAMKVEEIVRDNEDIMGELKVMIASDSMKFISYIKEHIPNIYVVPGEVKHIDTAGKTSDDQNLKMFIDYYMIAGARKVYNIVGPGMWKSAFSEYPAKIGSIEFERVFIN